MGTGAFRRLGLALAGAVLVLKFDIVLDLVARIEQLVQTHAIELGKRDQVLGIGRALRALPFTDRLARQTQLSRQPFLAKALAAAKVGEPLRSFYIHGSSYAFASRAAGPLLFLRRLAQLKIYPPPPKSCHLF